jgi:DeoR/GlpR family transcriptional regulator of sugar metabolism
MLIVERQKKLLELLRERQASNLESLAEAQGVSASTVRRDLDTLEKQGLVQRTHGGAIYRGRRRQPVALDERLSVQIEAKKMIGRHAAQLVQPNMTLFLDGGSTIYYAAQLIEARPLQVVTNSLAIASLFANDEHTDLILVGGSLYPRTGVVVGPIALNCLKDLHADLLLFSTAGILDGAAYNLNIQQAEVEQVMMRQAASSLMLMDSTKFGRKSLTRVCGVDEVGAIITDPEIDARFVNEMGLQLQIAESEAED